MQTNVTKAITLLSVLLLSLGSLTTADLTTRGRQGRFFDIVRLNPASRLNIGIQITVPVSVFMPNWAIFGKQSRSLSSKDYLWSWTQRSFPQSSSTLMSTCPTEKVQLEDYFYMLQIDLEPCQERFVCELASNPSRFLPLSEIILKKLAVIANELDGATANRRSYNSPADYLVAAARVGVDPDRKCHQIYEKCPVAADSMINMSYLWMWQLVYRLTNIRFTGEADTLVLNV